MVIVSKGKVLLLPTSFDYAHETQVYLAIVIIGHPTLNFSCKFQQLPKPSAYMNDLLSLLFYILSQQLLQIAITIYIN